MKVGIYIDFYFYFYFEGGEGGYLLELTIKLWQFGFIFLRNLANCRA